MRASQPAWRNARYANKEKKFGKEVVVFKKVFLVEEVVFGKEILIRKKELLEKERVEEIVKLAQIQPRRQ